METALLRNAKAILPDRVAENSSILIKSGRIAAVNGLSVGAEREIDLQNATVFAGFIDIHNHGAVGFDVNAAKRDDLIEISKFLTKKGVTAWLPTFVPDSDEVYRKVIGEINKVIQIQDDLPIAQIIGVHYEGVFANETMCGALRPEFFKKFRTGNEIGSLPKLGSGIHLTTLAPEIEGGVELIKELVRQNWIVSIGHTRADPATLEAARKAGARHLTHFFNAMSGIHHRDIGVAGWGLLSADVTFDIIADKIHVAPEMLRFAIEQKSPEKVSLISDSVAPTGLGDGEFELWGEKISVENGKTRNERGSIAGSVITMLEAVKNLRALGFSEVEISKMASANPAKLLLVEKDYGTIEVGKRADLVVFDEQGEIVRTFVGGKEIRLNR
jgi:N-acetylglucosamine-6-phosphate deacetylase